MANFESALEISAIIIAFMDFLGITKKLERVIFKIKESLYHLRGKYKINLVFYYSLHTADFVIKKIPPNIRFISFSLMVFFVYCIPAIMHYILTDVSVNGLDIKISAIYIFFTIFDFITDIAFNVILVSSGLIAIIVGYGFILTIILLLTSASVFSLNIFCIILGVMSLPPSGVTGVISFFVAMTPYLIRSVKGFLGT